MQSPVPPPSSAHAAPAPAGAGASAAGSSGPGPDAERLTVGRVVAAQGLRGEVRVLPLSDFPERFTRPGRRWLWARGGDSRAVDLLSGRQLPGRELFVVRLAGIDSRDAAEAIVGHDLQVAADDRPPLAPGEFHLLDLVGLEVRLLAEADGDRPGPEAAIGRVTDLIHAGNDLLAVERLGSEGEQGPLLIPFVKEIVPVVDLRAGWIGITPPPGLLDL